MNHQDRQSVHSQKSAVVLRTRCSCMHSRFEYRLLYRDTVTFNVPVRSSRHADTT